MKKRKNYFSLLLLACLIALTGCGGRSPQADFYTLSSMEQIGEMSATTVAENTMAIGIGPVKFPDELERSSIVTHSGENRLKVNEIHRWGGSLRENFNRVMVENLAYLLKTDRVVARPWERYFKPDYRIAMNVQRFSGRLGEYAELKSTWMIFNDKKDIPVLVKKSIIQEPVTDGSYDAFVAAQSRALASLSRVIASAIVDIQKK